jgi:hypothetical protein
VTNLAHATDVAPVRKPGQPVGELPRWKLLYEAMAKLKPGDLLSYEEMGELLGLDFLEPRGKQAILGGARKAAEELRQHERKVFRIVRGLGYQVAQPGQVIELARRHQARAVAEVEAGHAKIEAIDLAQVDVTTARLIEATAMGFARQALIMRQLDVRQDRLETAMAAVTVTAQAAITRVEETSTRVDTNQAEIQQLQQRIAELEAHQRGTARSTSSLHPGFGS